MSFKYKYEEVKNYIEIESNSGCILLDEVYIDSHTPLKIKCRCGDVFYKPFSEFKSKGKDSCPKCKCEKYYLSKRTKYIDIKNFIENVSNSGCKLITEEKDYVKTSGKIKIQCKCGDIYTTTFNKFFNNQSHKQQCDKCGQKNHSSKILYKYQDIKTRIEKENCILITEEKDYVSTDTILTIRCKCGNIFYSTYGRFTSKYFTQNICDECRLKKARLLMCMSYEEVFNLFECNGCKLLTTYDEYWNLRNNKEKVVSYICSCGNISTVDIMKFKLGQRCEKCKKQRMSQTSFKNYGVSWSTKSPEVMSKSRQTMYQNGTAPCSNPQRYINNLYGGELNYPVKTLSLDIAFPNDELYIEYDGGMHRGRIILGDMTDKEFNTKEIKRTYILMKSGWKEIRIISKQDWIPSDPVLLDMLSYAREYLKSHHYIKFDVDNSCIINSQGSFPYDFGKLRKITKRDLKEIA